MNKENDGTCTKCKERDLPGRCICSDPMWIVIPAGGHIHIQCPVHGDRKIYSSEPMLGCADKWVNDGPGPTQYWTETKTRDDIIWESYCD